MTLDERLSTVLAARLGSPNGPSPTPAALFNPTPPEVDTWAAMEIER